MFRRIMNLFKGFLGLFISGLEKANPKALIEAEKENLRKQIAKFNDSLASQAGFMERLLRQVKNLEQKEKELTARITANIKAGNRDIAGNVALDLQTVKEQLEENRAQLEVAEATYKKMLKARDVSVKEAQDKIESLKRLISETEMMEAQAELQEMATGMVTSIGSSGDTLNRLDEYLKERRDKAAGRAKVASSSVDIKEFEMKDSERSALAAQALAEFESSYGFSTPAKETVKTEETKQSAPAPQKELGPQSTNNQ